MKFKEKKSVKEKSKIKGEKKNTRLTFCPLEKRRSTKS